MRRRLCGVQEQILGIVRERRRVASLRALTLEYGIDYAWAHRCTCSLETMNLLHVERRKGHPLEMELPEMLDWQR